ncbi:hypothetical protein [Eptesicus fuscus gammaherpesvirus]|uniref:Protein UL91 n=1 Tax=vespertilionid gammaherpesvirus 3 TaxID=2846598 RepID=A0A2D0ZNY5_9GAMA|nr:hypothetical protein [Eptesicus fuscus gammaherpesvirus]ATA58259.1 hypothetical protein [Eptesicus fuscus gammaherpesvirus]WAH70955.1 UL91 [Eptesicus fuscus gammaherpesvirus]
MSLSAEDFEACHGFFKLALPELLSRSAGALSDLGDCDTTSQKLELLCLFLDIVGTECLQEAVSNRRRAVHQEAVGTVAEPLAAHAPLPR